ncbi:MAG TPA: DUF370 domain-containing protein [Firmicutes bacterium]|jgi:hypothetical protein|nr:MAG: hypothetical protein AA931_08465 [Peptococcaceae bacterium 1109]HHT74104.1 DUF370 domain-containing protein [Bacillota bacterium]
MFLHLGNDKLVPLREVIALFDLTETNAALNNDFLQMAKEAGFMIELTDEPVSCVITDKTIYLSPVSCGTLKARAEKRSWGM